MTETFYFTVGETKGYVAAHPDSKAGPFVSMTFGESHTGQFNLIFSNVGDARAMAKALKDAADICAIREAVAA